MTDATTPDQDFLQRWRLVVQLASGSRLAEEFQPSLTQLVTAIERWADEHRDLSLVDLRERLALSIYQQRLLATVLVDRRSRFHAAQLAAIAWLAPEREVDWTVAAPALVQLEQAGLVRAMDDHPRTPATRYAPGPALADLVRLARVLERPAPEAPDTGLAQRLAAASTLPAPVSPPPVSPPPVSPPPVGPAPAAPEAAAPPPNPEPAPAATPPTPASPWATSATRRVNLIGTRTPPAPVPAPPPPEPEPAQAPIGRWELELWAICFRTRQAIHRWIRAHHDPYKAFVGNYANAVDAPKVEALAAEAERIEDELTTPRDERETALARFQRVFDLGPADARILLYLFLAEVTDTGLPLEGRAILAAVASDALIAQTAPRGRPRNTLSLADASLGPGCPLVKLGWIHVAVNGNTPYTTAYQLNRAALSRIAVDPVVRPSVEKVTRAPTDGLGEMRDPRVQMADVILPASTTDELYDALALVDAGARELLPEPVRRQLLYKGRGTVLLFEGPPGTGKTMAAEALARHLDRKLFIARYDRVEDFLLGNSQKNVSKLFEEAAKAKAVLVLDEADALLASRTPVHQAWDQHRNTMVNLMLGCLEEHDGVVILTTNLAINLDPALERRLTARVRFGLPGLEERQRLWDRYLSAELPISGTVDKERLAHQYPMSGARIRNAVLSALRKALRRHVKNAGADAPAVALTVDELTASAAEEFRASYRDRGSRDDGADAANIGDLRTPAVNLDRVVLPDDVRQRLRDALVTMAPAARELFESPAFLDTFRTGRGVVMLFEGPPGTGKTLTAEAVAGELSKSMYLVTPERILSKWYGQTERALARVFDEAAGQQAVLVIDEADSLLESRGDAMEFGSRTANNSVNILLRKLDECTGVAILITNRPANLDPALERRLAVRLTFAPPEPAERESILRRHIPEGVRLADDVDLAQLATAHALSGGRLRNAVLTAIRRMLSLDPAGRVLSRVALEEALRDARESAGPRPIGFGAAEGANPDRGGAN